MAHEAHFPVAPGGLPTCSEGAAPFRYAIVVRLVKDGIDLIELEVRRGLDICVTGIDSKGVPTSNAVTDC